MYDTGIAIRKVDKIYQHASKLTFLLIFCPGLLHPKYNPCFSSFEPEITFINSVIELELKNVPITPLRTAQNLHMHSRVYLRKC